MNKGLFVFQNRAHPFFFSELVPLSALRRTTITKLGLLSCTDSLIQQIGVMMCKLSPFLLSFVLFGLLHHKHKADP